MAHRSDGIEFVRSVGSPSVDEDTSEKNISVNEEDGGGGGVGSGEGDAGGDLSIADNGEDDADLPQCKIRRNYSCNLCPFFSQNPRSFLYHSRDVHFDRIKIYECSQCLYASKHSQKLQRHINMIHVAGKNRVKRGSRMIRAEKRKEPRPIKPKPPDPCPEAAPAEIPKEEDSDPGELEIVLRMEEENGCEGEETVEGEFKCSVCNFKNRNQKLIRRHEKIVHLKKRFLRCSKCSYVTHVKARYTKHVKYHSMPMIKCDLCDFRTPYKWNLDRHYKNHSGTGAFQCSKCNFRADIKQSLTVHEMNHHVPPVGQGAIMARRKNKVGGSEALFLDTDGLDNDEMELLRMEREDSDSGTNQEVEPKEYEDSEKTASLQNLRNVKVPYSNKRESANNNHLQTDFIHPDDIVPRYGKIFVKNLKCKFCSYKAVFSPEIWRHEKRMHGYVRPENKKENAPKRPPPKLIPIQNKSTSAGAILKIPSVRNKPGVPPSEASPVEKPVNEKEFNEMCKKSCLTSSLKDFVSLIGDEEGLKTIPDSSREDLETESAGWVPEPGEDSDARNEETKQKQTDLLKKKNASFFDKLKEKLMTGNSEEQSLFCEVCGHESKCLSEAVAHQKRHSSSNYRSDDSHQENDIVLSGAELSSTRCQHCRQRCKTSTDLINHLKSCKAFGAAQSNFEDVGGEKEVKLEMSLDEEEKAEEEGKPMENRVFVWNDLRHVQDAGEEGEEGEEGEGEGEEGGEEGGEEEGEEEEEEEEEGMDVDAQMNGEPLTTLPGYGTVTSKGSDNTESGNLVMEADPRLSLTLKKVFKCPHCSFWASTASRFHVHIVGHLNKKPFECSLCLYRSNWRWDITKHIRLKSLRDPSHSEAKVNMTDETGRRNYSKYNRFLTMMRVQEPTAESSGTGRRSRPSDATQGNVTEKDIIPLPAPPRLTRAPAPGVSHQVPPPQGIPLRPPPPLKAAHQVPPQQSLLKSSKEAGKKTFWKCKKCSFRDAQKGRVLLHVKKHYMFKKGEKSNPSNSDKSAGSLQVPAAEEGTPSEANTTESRSLLKKPSYRCGHCHQVSNWKHVIQRHCKLKHNGDALIQVGWKDEPQQVPAEVPVVKPREKPQVKVISCDICPFTTDTEGDLTAHKLNHVDRPGSIFKCTYCPFYVPSKIAVLEHMEIHGVNDGCLSSLKVDNFDPSECNEAFSIHNTGGGAESTKRYKCRQCPYLSNSRTQFLYHKQFHRPRDSPFKCMYCSYNVTRRHLLHQHLRVHHKQKDIPRLEPQPKGSKENSAPIADTGPAVEMPEIPLVWVLKSGNIQKMFKCRWCPHVNVRKINIQEHEKMHRANENKNLAETGPKLQCSDCNYTCNNAGVLASHVKVHQGFFGEIRSLVDPTRPEADQIQELQNKLQVIESEVQSRTEGAVESVHDEPLSSQPENAYNHTTNVENVQESKKFLNFCDKCPARFFFRKELRIHSKFHMIHLPFRCSYCTYTARQRPHLLAHYKVHSQEYQEKTTGLVESYAVSPDYPQPKTAVVTKESYVMEGPVWMVTTPEPPKGKSEGHQKPVAKHACHRCPAKFFKSVALQYHLTLHGGSYQHKCKYCDYTVKTYGNLIKHQLVHEDSRERATKGMKFSYSFPIVGTDLVQPRVDDETGKRKDPQFGTLMFGSPEFIYPTYLKNGKIKQKKYKCHKCPSAFEKRDQYCIHLSLHGSKQKYSCEKCDYSVKYYANYVQHMRKHQNHDEAVKARKPTEEPIEDPIPEPKNEENEKTAYELTLLEQQSLLLQERKKSFEDKEEERKTYGCRFCPYGSNRRDAVDNHAKRHYRVSGTRSGFECMHCDYSATQGNFLREHTKLHFNGAFRHKAEAYLKCEKMELWCCDEQTQDEDKGTLVFQDKGEEEAKRFHPPIEVSRQEEDDWRIYVNPETGEPVGEDGRGLTGIDREESPVVNSPQNDDLMEMVEEHTEEVTEQVVAEQAKPKIKRWRGKNWKCKKCPHAFGKRDQYLRHVALHGSNQRHNCDICDYSVKFYTNYVQHMRMHQMHEPNRVIYVKKNLQSLEESSKKKDCDFLLEENTKRKDCDFLLEGGSKRKDCDFLMESTGDSDSYLSQEGKPCADALDHDYSSLDSPYGDNLIIDECAKNENSNSPTLFE